MEDLVHDADGMAELPAGGGQDDPIIHVADVADAGELAHGQIQRGEIERAHERGKRAAERDALACLCIISVARTKTLAVLADDVDEFGINFAGTKEPQQGGVADIGVVSLGSYLSVP